MFRQSGTYWNSRGCANDLWSRCCQKQGGEGEKDGLGDINMNFRCKGQMNIKYMVFFYFGMHFGESDIHVSTNKWV